MANVQKTFALILGIVLLLVGVLGYFSNPLVSETGFFGSNGFQDLLHIVAGVCGIYAGTKGVGKDYNMTIGWIGVVLGIIGFIPGLNTLLATWFNINNNISVLHIVLGVIALGVYYSAKK